MTKSNTAKAASIQSFSSELPPGLNIFMDMQFCKITKQCCLKHTYKDSFCGYNKHATTYMCYNTSLQNANY